MKKLLILSFLLFNLQCLFAGDDQENLSILQLSPLFGQKINYNKKENDLMTYFMFNQHETSSRNVSRASDVSDLSRCSSVGLDLSNLRVTSPNETSRSELKNGLKPESRYASPIKGDTRLDKFSPEQKKILSPESAKKEVTKLSFVGIINPSIRAVCRKKLISVRKMEEKNTMYEDSLNQNEQNKKQLKRGRSNSFDDENDQKISRKLN